VSISGTYLLSGLWPPFAEAVRWLLQWCEYLNLSATITDGYRPMEEQAQLYQLGRSQWEVSQRVRKFGQGGAVTDAAPGQSAHNYGLAVDFEGPDQRAVRALAERLGFGIVSWDPGHVEWPNWRALL
jgi:hypothetical protein